MGCALRAFYGTKDAMTFMQRFARAINAFAFPDNDVVRADAYVDEPRLAPTLYNAPNIGLTDDSQPNVEQQRGAWRGLLYRCLDIRSSAIASAMIESTVERRGDQLEYEAVEPMHPWVALLEKPNPNMSAFEFWKTVSLLRDLTGSADLIVRTDRVGVPIELYIPYPAFGEVYAIPDSSGGVSGYVFQRVDGEEIPFTKSQVVRIKNPHPLSPYEKASLIQAAAFQIDSDLYMKIYRRDTMRKGMPINFALTSEQELTEAQVKLYAEKFKNRYMGIESIGEVPVMGKGLKPMPLTLNSKDLEFVNGAKLNNTEILQITGVPEGMLSQEANRANAEASRATFYQNTVVPEMLQVTQALTHGFEKAFDAEPGILVVRPPDLTPANPEFDLKRRTDYLSYGLRTINDLRQEDGYEPVEGGDLVLIPSNLTTLDSLIKKQDAVDQPQGDQGQGNNNPFAPDNADAQDTQDTNVDNQDGSNDGNNDSADEPVDGTAQDSQG